MKKYKSILNRQETETAIKFVKDTFQKHLASNLNLQRVTAPLFVKSETGLNDNLSGTEQPVSFIMKHTGEKCEIVHSLAKWKRMKLYDLHAKPESGIYTDMNAIRCEETLDNIHSLYVDQWDWEAVINDKQYEFGVNTLYNYVSKIYSAIINTLDDVHNKYPQLSNELPKSFKFITAEELLHRYPKLSPEEREHEICKKYGAVFICGIGHELSDGKPHGMRSPDYDDWSTLGTFATESESNPDILHYIKNHGLNGDLIIWYEPLQRSIELSSMGVRVNAETLKLQCELSNTQDRLKYQYHQMILNNELPQTIGGGIGQSRLCMVLLEKIHIGEVQASIWDNETMKYCKDNNIEILS
jgi:aspartate--ammonia ligase